jgi:glycosyltransferase involved in cell wall biosynthesis
MADDLAQHFSIPRSKLSIHANPIDIDSIRAVTQSARERATPQPLSAPRLLCAGRLSHEKGIDLLLHAFAIVLNTYPTARLTILGNGPLQSSLQELAHDLNIDHAVSFPGFSTDLPIHYAQSTLFVLPSRYEGMPNALLEAAAAQLPIVATPASRGLSDLLRGQPGIWLTASITAEAIADTILLALKTLQSTCQAPALFDHSFLAPFETSQSIAAYSTCFEKAAAKARA